MGLLSLVLIAAGAVLIAVGASRARGPYRRYMALREQDENVARYEAWRGGSRPDAKTGASVAMAMLRRQTQIGVGVVIGGFVVVIVGFIVR